MDSRCVILDIGGVLEITPRTGWQRSWEQRLGLSPGTVNRRLGEVWRAGRAGELDEPGVRARGSAEIALDEAAVDAFMTDLWAEYLGTANEELIACVRGLRKRCGPGLGLGILSNSFAGAREREEAAYGFGALVERIVHSHGIGVLKPGPRAYEAVCAAMGARPQDCLFVDDLPENVEAAREFGMHGHLHEDNARTIARITAHVGPVTEAPRP
ncbi:HAD-IA family hydrolase [Streptomyces verrucosisporus]|uniref:HAD-IA family hydrolase n=1 Tax=Streptomyces verrucosisporus TaxID=1695161 RepID=UPI0019D2E6F4|nr:HAD-IA family hydrolase [Streptomyces verrucosisporus]MBN3931882.1 HAD-IA family hydrolase [Streptomyces verrucosisporus]